ncbi:MAG: Flp family type IVb pilin [Nocardioidaceae bacterium]
MSYPRSNAGRRLRDEGGASAVEYGLLIALIAAAIVTAVYFFGGMTNSLFQGTCTAYKQNNSVAGAQTCS